ncbi:unnamed protein product, partial [Didymodactylos carnosus]
GKRQARSQTVEEYHHYYYATKAANDTETSAQMIVEFRLHFSIDCLQLICQTGTVQTVTTKTLIVIRFEEDLFITFFSSTTSSDGSRGNTTPTVPNTSPTATVRNQPDHLSSVSRKAGGGGNGNGDQ